RSLGRGDGPDWWQPLFIIVLLPAVCEELAFRGFILSALRRHFRPWTAILLSSFLFALYHMNVFQFVPTFLLGVVLGLLTSRSGSVFPAMLLHLLYNGLLVSITVLQRFTPEEGDFSPLALLGLRVLVVGTCALVAVFFLWRLGRGSWAASSVGAER